jgi:hypothetical protein
VKEPGGGTLRARRLSDPILLQLVVEIADVHFFPMRRKRSERITETTIELVIGK